MKTAKEKAEDFLTDMAIVNWKWDKMVKNLTVLLKEQDRDTRHACAEAVITAEVMGHQSFTAVHHAACMNVKAI